MGIVDTLDLETLAKRQIENEEDIIDGGIKKYREALASAEEKKGIADTMPGRWILSEYIQPIVDAIQAFVHESVAGKPGRHAVGATILNRLNYDACAFVTLRIIINAITCSSGEKECSSIIKQIAQALEEEMQYNYMAEERTQTYKYWMQQINAAPHKKTRYRLRVKLKQNFESLPSFNTEAEQLAVRAAAAFLMRTACDKTRVAAEVSRVQHGKTGPKTIGYLVLTDTFKKQMKELHCKAEALWPKFEPMICPPRPWTSAFGGGFIGTLGTRTKLVRTSSRDYLEDINNNQLGNMSKVLTALNAIQDTPWRINQTVLDLMLDAFTGKHSQHFGLPANEKLPMPPWPEEIDTSTDEERVLELKKDWVSDLKIIQCLERKRESRCWTVHNMLLTAEKYRNEAAIWFAHNLDWRGRIYPLSSHLSPQGEELHRALLEFADGVTLETDEAVEWLAIHGTGCFGYDKVSFADRVRWVHEHEEQIRQTVAAPLDYRWWTEADKPWMFLAWCFEWVGYLTEGKAYVSHIPVAMDGSCNGLQNFAAMLKHEETARAVNLIPSDVPNDIYQQVADKVIPRVAKLAQSDPRSDDEILAEAYPYIEMVYADKDHVKKEEKLNRKEKKRIKKAVKDGTMTDAEAKRLLKTLKKPESRIDASIDERARALWAIVSARWILEHISRKLVKRPVMTYPYSVTIHGIYEQLKENLLEMHGKDQSLFPSAHIAKIAGMLKTEVYEAVQETVVAAAVAMRWLREVAKKVAENNLPVKWVSPVGMPVLQDYRKQYTKRLTVSFGGIQYQPHVSLRDGREIDASKQAAGVAPNFVHSCDASHLMFTVLACREEDVHAFHMIHDSYGCHARHAAALARCLREQFVAMYGEGTVLSDFHKQLCEQTSGILNAGEALPEPPSPENFDVSQVLESKYFFA